MQYGERLRHREVVIHRLGEGVGHDLDTVTGEAGSREPALDALEEARDAVERGLRLGQRAVVEVDGRPVVRRPEVVADYQGTRGSQQVGRVDRVAERLAHLLAVDVNESV